MVLMKRYILTVSLIIFGLSGCARLLSGIPEEDLSKRIAEARRHFEAVERLDVRDRYPDDFETAEKTAVLAETLMKGGKRKLSMKAANQSIEASRRILNRYYLDTISELAKEARRELERRTGKDPDHPLREYIPKVERIIENARDIEKDRQIASLEKVFGDMDEVLRITRVIQTNISTTLSSDVSFRPGEYRLSEKGETIVREFMEEIFRRIDASPPGKRTALNIKVVGYTDQINFGTASTLVAELKTGIEEPVPRKDPDRRILLNRKLSQFRAESIGDFISRIFEEKEMPPSRLRLRLITSGRGEQLPAGLEPPYSVSDQRRRICKIHAYSTTR